MKRIYFIFYYQARMPEIWLKYGSTDVVLDIRFENLSSQVSSGLQALSYEQAKAELDAVPVTDSMLVLALSSSKPAARAVSAIFDSAKAKGFASVTVDVPAKLAGAPSAILRNLYPERMAEAFSARQENAPAPGIEGKPLKVALSAVEGLQATSVELVPGGAGIAGVPAGTVSEAFSKALAQFKPATEVQVDSVRSAIVSASNEASVHSTLASSLNSLWNCAHAVKEGGTVVLLAECREGLGGGALQDYVEGRLGQEQLANAQYSEG